jgi:hypothetical protein
MFPDPMAAVECSVPALALSVAALQSSRPTAAAARKAIEVTGRNSAALRTS